MKVHSVGEMLKVNHHLQPHSDTANPILSQQESPHRQHKGSEPRWGKTGLLNNFGQVREGGTNTHLQLSATEKLGHQLPHLTQCCQAGMMRHVQWPP